MNELIDLIGAALLIIPVFGLASSFFLWRVYLSDEMRPRSWILFQLALGSTIVALASIAISAVAIVRLAGQSIGEGGGLILAVVILLLESLPLWYSYQVLKRRREGLREDES